MQSSVIIALLCCIIGATLGHPRPEDLTMKPTPPPQYPLNLRGGGGGQPGDGYGFNVAGRQNVWTSDNGRHEVDLTGRYGQHLGGPYGNSPASYDMGANYRFRF